MDIRRAVQNDLNALNALMHSSSAYQGHYAAMLKGYSVAERQLIEDQIFIACEGGEVAGFYSLMVAPPELDLMFVADAYQGRGVGRMLFLRMTDNARRLGIDHVKIVSHPPAEQF